MFSQDTSVGGFFPSKEDASNSGSPDLPQIYSRLSSLGSYVAPNGMYHMRLVYPESGSYNEWIQTSNPRLTAFPEGFSPIHLDLQETVYSTSGLFGTCTQRNKIDRSLPVVTTEENVPRSQDCQFSCSLSPTCDSFAYQEASQTCQHLGPPGAGAGTLEDEPGTTSGPETCGEEVASCKVSFNLANVFFSEAGFGSDEYKLPIKYFAGIEASSAFNGHPKEFAVDGLFGDSIWAACVGCENFPFLQVNILICAYV